MRRGNLEQGGLGGGGLEALWIPFPKWPGVLSEGWWKGELHSLALLSFGRKWGRPLDMASFAQDVALGWQEGKGEAR